MGALKNINKKLLIIENFLPNLEYFLENIQKINLYDNDTFNSLFNTNQKWPGLRSDDLLNENKFLFFLILQNLNKVCFLDKYSIQIYVHLRKSEDVFKDWIHKDVEDYAFLIYLNKTNLKSGTYLYNEGEIISDVKYVQNRFVIYSGSYDHMGYGYYGDTANNGRLTLNGFIKIIQ
jgi:hypothetical protein